MIFDPTMTKKKKKKKKPFMLEEEGGEGDEGQQVETKETEAEVPEEKEFDLDEDEGRKKETSDDLDDLNFFNQKKKKKKSKKDKIFDADLEEGMKELKIETEPSETQEEDDLMLPAKKKKSRKGKEDTDSQSKDDGVEDEDSKNMDDITFSTQTGPAWAGSERDYTYDELLNRVFNIMREKNPDMVAGEKRKFVMKPPQVVRVGTKKTSFVNFTDICKLLHRQPKHLLAFLLADGSIDGNNQLVIKGRFQQKQIENVLRRYIKEYVTCHTCRSPDTILQKDTHVSLPMLRRQHQDRIPGRDGQESAAACQSQLTPVPPSSHTLHGPSVHLYSTTKLNKSTHAAYYPICSGSLKCRTEFSAISNASFSFLLIFGALKSPMHTKGVLICSVWLWSLEDFMNELLVKFVVAVLPSER
ncbi:Eukaryotic translation initiation factor 2 subunit 2 [Labeo rohita]|uniref:Eukaryotic translation initiation factor 2 subunit 2 n=1 Tax=Labeo rohita TaxID=84645 RepID=A0ABQ8MNQ2_LABRO|nr:Eukaryotic translation initiation factor 2 subunit 2 [Labeo rohita]